MVIEIPVIMDMLLFYKYMSIFYQSKYHKIIVLIVFIIISRLIEGLVGNYQTEVLLRSLLYVLFFLPISIIFQGKLLNQLNHWLIMVALLSIMDTLSVLYLQYIYNANESVSLTMPIYIGIYLVSRVLVYLFISYKKKTKRVTYFRISNYKWIAAESCLIFAIVIFLFYMVTNLVVSLPEVEDMTYWLSMLFLLLCFLLIHIYEQINNKVSNQIKHNSILKQNEYHKNYRLMIESYMEEVGRLKHDMKNHVGIIKAYVENEKYKELRHYIDALYMPIESENLINIRGNPEISALISTKIEVAKRKDIQFKYNLNFNEDILISTFDSCLLYGNIIDNAIEACENQRTDAKRIKLDTGINKGHLYIDCVNTYDSKKLIKKKNQFISNKEDRKNHGKGLMIITEVVDKYGGNISVEAQEDLFIVKVTVENTNKS